MKKQILAGVIFAVLLSGCGKENNVPAVSSDFQRMLVTAQNRQTNLPLSELDLPDHYSEQAFMYVGEMPLEIDADIVVPEANQIPVAKAVPRKMTQSEADRFLSVFVGQNEFKDEKSGAAANRVLKEGAIEGFVPYSSGRYMKRDAHIRITEDSASFYRNPSGNDSVLEWSYINPDGINVNLSAHISGDEAKGMADDLKIDWE